MGSWDRFSTPVFFCGSRLKFLIRSKRPLYLPVKAKLFNQVKILVFSFAKDKVLAIKALCFPVKVKIFNHAKISSPAVPLTALHSKSRCCLLAWLNGAVVRVAEGRGQGLGIDSQLQCFLRLEVKVFNQT